MTIAQALKEKNRLVTESKKTKEKILKYNQMPTDRERLYNITELYENYSAIQEKIVAIKAAIHTASEPIRKDIFWQSEFKDQITFLRGIPCENGTIRERYSSDEGHQVSSEFNAKRIDVLITETEKHIEAIQDKLDKFNHTTEVTL